MAGPGVAGGTIYLLNARDYSWRSLDLDAFAETALCGALPWLRGEAHGIRLQRPWHRAGQSGDRPKLLAINHGGREAVEVFGLTANGANEPDLTWMGCVVAPANAQLNSVVALPEGGFAVTKFFDAANKNWTGDLFAGKPTGSVLQRVARRRLVGSRGLRAVGAERPGDLARRQRLFRRRVGRAQAAQISPRRAGATSRDRHRRARRQRPLGRGRAAAHRPGRRRQARLRRLRAERRPGRPDAWKVLRIDPETLAAEEVVIRPGSKEFGSATTALDLGPEYWIGTSRGNRIARVAKP